MEKRSNILLILLMIHWKSIVKAADYQLKKWLKVCVPNCHLSRPFPFTINTVTLTVMSSPPLLLRNKPGLLSPICECDRSGCTSPVRSLQNVTSHAITHHTHFHPNLYFWSCTFLLSAFSVIISSSQWSSVWNKFRHPLC